MAAATGQPPLTTATGLSHRQARNGATDGQCAESLARPADGRPPLRALLFALLASRCCLALVATCPRPPYPRLLHRPLPVAPHRFAASADGRVPHLQLRLHLRVDISTCAPPDSWHWLCQPHLLPLRLMVLAVDELAFAVPGSRTGLPLRETRYALSRGATEFTGLKQMVTVAEALPSACG